MLMLFGSGIGFFLMGIACFCFELFWMGFCEKWAEVDGFFVTGDGEMRG
jgi:hypothetical protein